jgi:hypothetical protein
MTLYHLHGDGLHRAAGDRKFAIAHVAGTLRAATSAIFRKIAALTTRHLESAQTCHGDDGEEPSPRHDLVRYPQAPLILGDKWDF